jgi:hypothetical protein
VGLGGFLRSKNRRGIKVLGSIGTTSRGIEIAQLGGVGCMEEVEWVSI